MLLEHKGERPNVHPTAYVVPNATLCGDVTVGKDSRVMFGAAPWPVSDAGGPHEPAERPWWRRMFGG